MLVANFHAAYNVQTTKSMFHGLTLYALRKTKRSVEFKKIVSQSSSIHTECRHYTDTAKCINIY